jgi:hypothetical protein
MSCCDYGCNQSNGCIARTEPVFKLNKDSTAAVSNEVHWIPIDESTPLGVSMWLIAKGAGIAVKGEHRKDNHFFTHWFPNPRFKDE